METSKKCRCSSFHSRGGACSGVRRAGATAWATGMAAELGPGPSSGSA